MAPVATSFEPASTPMIARIGLSWHPYAGFVYFHLLLERLVAQGDRD
jgi:hypothetical protein